jgi:triosephosphate isomerase
MRRKPLIAGNWKLNKNITETKAFAKELQDKVQPKGLDQKLDIMIIPVFTSLNAAAESLGDNSIIQLGAQDLCQYKSGAYTGEVSAEMLQEIGVSTVLVGHSERREIFGETDAIINAKLIRAFEAGLNVILCCGEPLNIREQGQTDEWVSRQIEEALSKITDIKNKLVIAYEPIWAIGTGKTCDAAEANRVIKTIRNKIASICSNEVASSIRILYGGSVKSNSIEEQMSQSDIDGALIGGASLIAEEFLSIINLTASLLVAR